MNSVLRESSIFQYYLMPRLITFIVAMTPVQNTVDREVQSDDIKRNNNNVFCWLCVWVVARLRKLLARRGGYCPVATTQLVPCLSRHFLTGIREIVWREVALRFNGRKFNVFLWHFAGRRFEWRRSCHPRRCGTAHCSPRAKSPLLTRIW